MRSGVIDFLKRKLNSEPVHPMDNRLARQWIKRRLMIVFPELRYDPVALEQAYRGLSLEPHAGGLGDMQTYFEVVSPEV